MNNMPEVKIGVVAVSRDCFPESLSVSRREALMKAYKEKYGEKHIYECPICIVESEIHMVQALEDIKKAGCNALVVYLGNFGPEISETLLAKHFDGPKMFVAAAEESGNNLIQGRGDAYCGMLNASYNLKLRNIKAYIPEYPVGTAEECADMIHEFEPIARAVIGLNNLKIISFGPRPLNFLACNAPIQQLYNIADSVIAGKFAGEDALAAVGASYPVTMIFMAVAFGMNIGISVVISQLFGAKDFKEMKTAAYTGFISVAVLGVVLTVVGTVLCEPILRMLGTPENIMEDTALYLAIYIWGLLFLFIYNISSGVFTSLGDSKTPLWFLIASSVGNIVLDAVFVIVFHWGVGGVAWATFLAQGVASACAFWAVLRRLKSVETKEKPALFSGAMLRRISIVAIPSILQQSFVSIGNLCIQGLVNGFGSSAIAGYSAGVKLNTFAITSLTALSNSGSSFTGQNIGAGKMERVRSGFKAGLVMSLAVALVFMGAYVFRGENLLLLFMNSTSAEAIEIGKKFLLIVSLCYLFLALKLAADGVLRGAGAMVYFMITTFLDLILRVVLAFILVHLFGITGIWLSWPFGWVISSTLSLAFYLLGVWDPLKKKA